jgi:hypothetical protein
MSLRALADVYSSSEARALREMQRAKADVAKKAAETAKYTPHIDKLAKGAFRTLRRYAANGEYSHTFDRSENRDRCRVMEAYVHATNAVGNVEGAVLKYKEHTTQTVSNYSFACTLEWTW